MMEGFIFLLAQPAIWINGIINVILKIAKEIMSCYELNKLRNNESGCGGPG